MFDIKTADDLRVLPLEKKERIFRELYIRRRCVVVEDERERYRKRLEKLRIIFDLSPIQYMEWERKCDGDNETLIMILATARIMA